MLNGTSIDLQFHHFGLAVRRPDEATAFVAGLGYTIAKTVFDPVQNVHLTLCTHASAPTVEIIWPGNSPGPLDRITQRHASGIIYHLCFQTSDRLATLSILEKMKLGPVCVFPPAPALLFAGRKVSFYSVAGIGLIEILE